MEVVVVDPYPIGVRNATYPVILVRMSQLPVFSQMPTSSTRVGGRLGKRPISTFDMIEPYNGTPGSDPVRPH